MARAHARWEGYTALALRERISQKYDAMLYVKDSFSRMGVKQRE
jgi:hypothetical protein